MLRELPAVDVLRRVLLQIYTRAITAGKEVINRREKEPDGDGLPPGHARIASRYDSDARWGVKPEEFWLGYKLHVTETCDDSPPYTCGSRPVKVHGQRASDVRCQQVRSRPWRIRFLRRDLAGSCVTPDADPRMDEIPTAQAVVANIRVLRQRNEWTQSKLGEPMG